jgi:hypothetical protein
MNDPDRRSPYDSPDPVTPTLPAEAGSVGEVVGGLIAEARARAEAERAEAASRGPATRLLLLLTLVAAVSAGVTTFYGISNFMDAPIRATGSGYASKSGAARTRQDYDRYLTWSRTMWGTYAATFLFGSAFVWADDRGRRKRGRTDGTRRRP